MLIVDADLYLYRCTIATEEETDWGDDIWSLTTDLKIAKDLFSAQIAEFKARFNDDDTILCLSSNTNFRKVIEPTYKEQRRKTRKPLGYVAMLDWVQHHYHTFQKPDLEADDCMGILATKPDNIGKCVIVSDDKDMKTIPGKLYRPASSELLEVSESDANEAFFTQCLVGDPADGYPGLKGYGPRTAAKTLGTQPTWQKVEQAYVKAGLTRKDALHQARLARILRWSDWDSENSKPILYEGDKHGKAASKA